MSASAGGESVRSGETRHSGDGRWVIACLLPAPAGERKGVVQIVNKAGQAGSWTPVSPATGKQRRSINAEIRHERSLRRQSGHAALLTRPDVGHRRLFPFLADIRCVLFRADPVPTP